MKAVLLLGLLASCTDEINTSTAVSALSSPNLAPGEVKVWNFDGAAKPGVDPRFEKRTEKNAKDISYKQGPNQQITMTATNADDGGKPGQADIQLAIADLPVTGAGDHYYKGWLSGNVFDSDNKAIGFCGSGGFEKGDFHTQLQLAFMNGGNNLGLCYCNICPAKDNHGEWCSTDQWQTPTDDPPKVSGSGACKAPAGTDHVVVTLEAIAKGDTGVHHHGTAVFKKVVVGRCQNDGDCPVSMIPNDYGK